MNTEAKAGPRPVRAPRGTEISCKGWQQEAALRMLMNNLDPEVAEAPDELIVYGGAGKAARNWSCYDAIVRTLRRLERRRDAARAERQAGRRVPDARVGAARAHRQRQPGGRLGQLGRVPSAGRAGAHDVRADDRRLLDLHRHPGHPSGHVPDVRRRRAEALRRRPGRQAGAHRRSRGHGRCAAAGRHHGRRRRALRGGRSAPHRAAPGDRVRRRGDRVAGRGAEARGRGAGGAASRSPSPCSATPPTSTPSSCAAASSPTSSPTRRRRTTCSTATCPTA